MEVNKKNEFSGRWNIRFNCRYNSTLFSEYDLKVNFTVLLYISFYICETKNNPKPWSIINKDSSLEKMKGNKKIFFAKLGYT